MVRPVEGYMAEDGTFFSTEGECEIYEARLAVTSLVMEKLAAEVGVHSEEIGLWTEAILEWVYDNFDKFERFVKAKRALPTDMPEPSTTSVVTDLGEGIIEPYPPLDYDVEAPENNQPL